MSQNLKLRMFPTCLNIENRNVFLVCTNIISVADAPTFRRTVARSSSGEHFWKDFFKQKIPSASVNSFGLYVLS